jgi:hypothetical protein
LWDGADFDYDKAGVPCQRFHPTGLPSRKDLPTVAELHHESDLNKHVQRTYSRVLHHSAWLDFYADLENNAPRREVVRFVSVSQPCAGAWLNAVPKWGHFRVRTTNHLLLLQRRFGLPLRAVAQASGNLKTVLHKRAFDSLGDVASNEGEAGHQTRHKEFVKALRRVTLRAFGAGLKYEPKDYKQYSDHRPDLSLLDSEGNLRYLDAKVFCPLGSKPADTSVRGSRVAFGNTHPRAYEQVHGLREHGEQSQGNYRWTTGEGYVAPVAGDYARAKRSGVKVTLLLVEVFGGFHQDVLDFLYEARDLLEDKLSKEDYDHNTWATTKWFSFAVQQLSVTFHNAVAQEVFDAVNSADARASPVSLE